MTPGSDANLQRWPATFVGDNSTVKGILLGVGLLVIAVVAIPALIAQWRRLRRGESDVSYSNPVVIAYSALYLAVTAVLWLTALPAFFGAVDGRTADGNPIGNLWYATARFLVACLCTAAASTIPRRTPGRPTRLFPPTSTQLDKAVGTAPLEPRSYDIDGLSCLELGGRAESLYVSESAAVLIERDAHVLTITINRPEKRNAFNAEVLCRLSDAWDLLDNDPELRVAIMTGADGNFSAGADLDRLVGALLSGKPAENEFEERVRQDFSLLYKGFLKDHYVKKPIVAAVEGYCYAGGMEILQAFDIRVAAEDAQLAVSEVKRGLFPMSASTIRLPRQIPYTVAMDMLLVGTPITGRRAYEIGLVGHVTPPGGASARARELADQLAANGPLAVRNIKASVVENLEKTEAEAFKRELELGMEVMGSKDAKEGPRAFLEKRTPNFIGE